MIAAPNSSVSNRNNSRSNGASCGVRRRDTSYRQAVAAAAAARIRGSYAARRSRGFGGSLETGVAANGIQRESG